MGAQVNMMANDPFAAFVGAASRHFNFLETEYGFRFKGPRVFGYEASVTFESVNSQVIIHYEAGSPPWVEITRLSLDAIPVDERDLDSVSLETIMSSRGVVTDSQLAEYRDISDDQLDLMLARKALELRREANDLLRGDFASLPKLKKLAKGEAQRREAKLFRNDDKPESSD